ncbi:MAG: large-conductance mechanosensitive channel protein MscL [Planctomycetes bacterium]|nr:large-conductance mechanosensitive channel protein MscL [Planctomycetota bacterium]
MSLLKEFKAFAMRGNVMDMAVGIIIGGAFGQIVNSLVKEVIMPPIGFLLGKVDFSQLKLILVKQAVDAAGTVITKEVAVSYGAFINTIINFLIVAASVFMMVKVMSLAKKKEAAAPTPPPAPSNQELLLGEIRDILKQK